VLDGEKLGMEASCREAPWPCAGPNAAPAQNRPAKIVFAAVRFLAQLIGGNANMDGLLIFVSILIFSLPRSRKSTNARKLPCVPAARADVPSATPGCR
jgi:hypothetical protein